MTHIQIIKPFTRLYLLFFCIFELWLCNSHTGYKFYSWTGDATGTTNPLTITMNAAKNITANFVEAPVCVDVNATGNNDGSSWANAYTDLQTAMNSSLASSREVWVAKGTYKPTGSGRNATFTAKLERKVYGGFAGNEAILSDRDISLIHTTNATILSGDLNGNDNNNNILNTESTRQDNAYHVVTVKKAGGGDLGFLDGFIIQGGNSNGTKNHNCNTIGLNQYDNGKGAAIYTHSNGGLTVKFKLRNSIVKENTGTYYACFARFNACGAIRNKAYMDFENCIVKNNYSAESANIAYDGNQKYKIKMYGKITNTLIIGNSTGNATKSSAIYISSAGVSGQYHPSIYVTVVNSTIANNNSPSNKAVTIKLSQANSYPVRFYNSIIYNNGAVNPLNATGYGTAAFSNNIIEGGQFNNVGTDPMLRGDFKLLTGSPAIDTGDNSKMPAAITTDLANQVRRQNTTIDIGAFEGAVNQVNYTLTTIANAAHGSIATNPGGTNGSYSIGTDVTLTATPVSGYQFDSWSGVTTGNTNPLTITMDANKSITANFTVLPNPVPQFSNLPSTVTGAFTATINFDHAVTGFVMSDIQVSGAALSNFTAVSGTQYTVLVTPTSVCNTSITLEVPANVATDSVNNLNNVTSGVQTISVTDGVDPTIVTQDITVQLGANGSVTITAAQIDNGSTDNCSIASKVLDITSFDCSKIGAQTVTLTVTDAAGNTVTKTAVVTVKDTVKPTVSVTPFTIALNANNSATITYTNILNTASDNCTTLGASNYTISKSTFDCSNLGANNVVLTVTDARGNSETATAVVTVNANPSNAFVAVTQNITVQLNASGTATITPAQINNGSGSGCNSTPTLSLDVTTFDCSKIGTNTVTLTATDGAASVTATAVVTVEDSILPVVTTKPATVQLDANGSASITVSDIEDSITDNCTIASKVLDITTFDCSKIGVNTVTLTVTDVGGNISTKTAVVTVKDTVKPIVTAKPFTIALNANNSATITYTNILNTASDNCTTLGASNYTISKSTFDCSNLGANNVVLTVTDARGNSETATAVVTVNANPSSAFVAVTNNITVQLDANGSVTITPAQINNGSGSGCNSTPTLSLDKTSFDCSNIGANTVTLTATDRGASVTATATVTVEDSFLPVVSTKPATVQLDANGSASITVSDVEDSITDNCTIATKVLDITSFDCSKIGAQTVTITVTDTNGNIATATAVVTVEDTVKPTILTQNISLQLDVNNQISITTQDVDNGSTDNCTSVSALTYSLDKNNFTCADLGVNTVTLTVTDASGNSNTATTDVTVIANPNAVLTTVTKNITVQLDANGSVTITPQDVDNGSGSGCNSSPTLSLDVTSFDCSKIGVNTVTLTATDAGVTVTATATVTIEDTAKPLVITTNKTIELDVNGTAIISASDVDNGSSDNCSIATSSIDITSFDCSNLGENTVTLTVEDVNGNSSSATAVVTIVEKGLPIVITKNITVVLDETGAVTITASQVNDGSNDTCSGVASMSLDTTTFECPTLGIEGLQTVTLTVVDNNGNEATKTATVTFTAPDEDNDGISDACDSRELEIPKGFSLNGDGLNDEWVIKNIEKYPNSTLSVFNRWGRKVYEAKDYKNTWSGMATGKSTKLPVSSYMYIINLNTPGMKPIQGLVYINY